VFHLRPVNAETDFPRIAELTNMVGREPITAEMLHERMRNMPPGRVGRRMVAVGEDGRIAGFHGVLRDSWMRPGHFWMRVIVDRSLRHQGIGSLLYDNALEFIREQAATHVTSEVYDDCAECLQFAEHRGFCIERHMFESRLDLATFDAARCTMRLPGLIALIAGVSLPLSYWLSNALASMGQARL